MTTVVYRDGIMASDTQLSRGNLKNRFKKTFKFKDGSLFGISGELISCMRIKDWFASDMKGEPPQFADDNAAECMLVNKHGLFLIDGELYPIEMEDGFLAIGSGAPYALSAMSCGKTALEALEIASEWDAGTSAPFNVMRYEPFFKKKKSKKK
jgi:ATP-dependent protease HslVU (ClpYQ) peptidase subunit